MDVVTLTKDNFEQEVLAAKVPILIDFWATWCGPCQLQSPVVDEIAKEMGDQVKVCKVNVDEQASLALNYQTHIVIRAALSFLYFSKSLIRTEFSENQSLIPVKHHTDTCIHEIWSVSAENDRTAEQGDDHGMSEYTSCG